MCGRYGRRSDKQYVAEHYAMRRKVADLPPMPPGYNIAPGTFQPVVRLSEETGEREMCLMEWGLVPYWSTMHKMIELMTAMRSFASAVAFGSMRAFRI